MADGNIDYIYFKRWLSSIKIRHVAVTVAIIIGFYYLSTLSGLHSNVDRTDYKAVAMHFINTNPTIANKLGRVTSVSHIGAGGSAGKNSYNVYNLKGVVERGIGVKEADVGKKRSGVCYVTLSKDDERLWDVTSASLMIGGAEHKIPVTRSAEKRNIKVF